jgi:L-ascorbate metabolism protein UlaG (beta-lactamase superfamily)
MKITYLSHSCFFIETGTHRVIIDPFLTGNPLAKTKAADVKCDFVLLTHGHSDHLGDAVAIAKQNEATIIAPFELAMYCQAQGAKVQPMNHGGSTNFPFGRVKLTIAHHSSSIDTGDGIIYLGNPAGLLITAEGKTIFHAGDTALFLDMKLIGEMNELAVAIVPIGDNFTMGIEDAVKAVEFLKPGIAFPAHYNTFPPIQADPEEFVRKVEATGAKAKALGIGESYEVEPEAV